MQTTTMSAGYKTFENYDTLIQAELRRETKIIYISVAATHCRSIVQRYTAEWEKTVTRLGRWIDFKNDYKTMDPEYMESVWYDLLH